MKNIRIFYLKLFLFWLQNFQYIWIGVFSYCTVTRLTISLSTKIYANLNKIWETREITNAQVGYPLRRFRSEKKFAGYGLIYVLQRRNNTNLTVGLCLSGTGTPVRFSVISKRKIIFATSCLVFYTPYPNWKESTLIGKNLLPSGANSFFLEWTPFQKWDVTNFYTVVTPESDFVPLEELPKWYTVQTLIIH